MLSKQGLSLGKIAHYCGVTRKTILRWLNDGQLEGYCLPSGHHRVLPQEVARFMRTSGMPLPPELERHANQTALIVYGDESTRGLVSELLRQHFAVTSISSAIEACFRIGRVAPELLIFDLHLEGIDGFEFCRTIRRTPEFERMALIILTTKLTAFQRNRLDPFVDGIILKPFSPATLIETCREATRARQGRSS